MKINLQSRQKLVIGNWKMYGNLKKNANLMHKLIKELKCFKAIDIVLCIPFPYLSQAEGMLKKSHIKWGSQNVSQFEEGAYTGSISAQMIKDFKCQYAIIGHSERRALSSETYQSATNRFIQALHAHITPIFCVGETAEEKKLGKEKLVVKKQIRAVLNNLSNSDFLLMKKLNTVFTYEPVWAIGTGKNAKPDEAESMHQLIRQLIYKKDKAFSKKVRILYGGSLRPDNALSLFSMPNIDGGLVGNSSLNAKKFVEICKSAYR